MATIECLFSRTLFTNAGKDEDNGYRVYKYRLLKGDDISGVDERKSFTAQGYWLGNLATITYTLHGEWRTTSKGTQFVVENFVENLTATERGIKAFLNSSMIKGLTTKIVDRIYDRFGDNTLYILDNRIDDIMNIQGMNKKRMERLKESYILNRQAKEIVTLLAPYGVRPTTAKKVFDKFKENSCDITKKNPYRLLMIKGIGFITCDKIARGVNADMKSDARIKGAIDYALQCHEQSTGSCCMTANELIKSTQRLLEDATIPIEKIQENIKALVNEKSIMYVRHTFSRRVTYDAESKVATRIIELTHALSDTIEGIDEKLDKWEAKKGFKLHIDQRKAVISGLTHGFSLLIGGPGCGKTTIAEAIVSIRQEYGVEKDVILLAPTGKAAQKLSESTGLLAKTIHSRIKIRDIEDYTTENAEENPLKAGTIIIDESSMLDIWVAKALLEAIVDGSQVILVGDTDQLPSVGCGAVLRDIINSGIIPVARLTKIYRQTGDSKIITNAHRIRDGITELEYDKSSFRICMTDSLEDSAIYMTKIYKDRMKKYGKDEVVLLSPHHHAETASSVDNLNKILQQEINPEQNNVPQMVYRGTAFRVGDLVMQTKNTDEATNGDVGVVTSIEIEEGEKTLVVTFGEKEVRYISDELEQLELGYAMSIHKSQGSEYKCVILNLCSAHGVMRKRNLLYTAVTRAKVECILVSNDATVAFTIANEETNKRSTLLAEKIVVKEKQFAIPFKEECEVV